VEGQGISSLAALRRREERALEGTETRELSDKKNSGARVRWVGGEDKQM